MPKSKKKYNNDHWNFLTRERNGTIHFGRQKYTGGKTLSLDQINCIVKIDTRARGRYAAIKIENTGTAESWRFGTFQADLQPDGRR